MRRFLNGYFVGLKQNEAKPKKKQKKNNALYGQDPYEIPKNEWEDYVKSWPDVIHAHICCFHRGLHKLKVSKIIKVTTESLNRNCLLYLI